ncbi:MAG: gamma-glutamyl-gamma-aminobutyrate hydrolase family protein [Lachnospiraceae bacterium]|nr:gamma-glutamyl-gamma-aminobutyrate hydrolase family protein [Lachnospiraceae bacterium]
MTDLEKERAQGNTRVKKIAIVGRRETARNENYYAAVEACGAQTVTLITSEDIKLAAYVDGIVLPGGVDLNPALYHEKNTASENIDEELDKLEFAVIREAVERKIPILGICRGHQILNVYFGGSLIQNVERCDIHTWTGKEDRVHATEVKRGSFLYEIYGAEKIAVNSAHHQAVKELGAGLEAVQFSQDGIIEAVHHVELPIYAVQWHPERMCLKNARTDTVDGLKLFVFFLGKV